MLIPKELKHKPVFAVEDYAAIDGHNENTDAQGLSLGLAQWNDRGRVDVSAKVWRHTGEKWSRQSEELPLHRVVDLALLLLSAKRHLREAYRLPDRYNPEQPVIDRIPLQGGAMTVRVCDDNPMIRDDIRLFEQSMARDDELLSERLHRLADLLADLGYGTQRPSGKDFEDGRKKKST